MAIEVIVNFFLVLGFINNGLGIKWDGIGSFPAGAKKDWLSSLVGLAAVSRFRGCAAEA